MKTPVYLDYNATTPVDPRVVERMLPYFTDTFGNASSKAHAYGWAAEEAVDVARDQVAALLGAEPGEIVFTSGATESINLAIKGVAAANASRGRHLITWATEHSAVLDTCRAMERSGFEVTYLPVDEEGRASVEEFTDALRDDTILVAMMWANNETGVLNPIEAFAEVARAQGVYFFADATQAVGKAPVSVEAVDLLACSAHKFYGPKGVGALYVRRRNPRVRLTPVINGGGQEQGLRGGTLNVPGIVGMGAAAELAREELEADSARLRGLRDRLERTLEESLPELVIHSRNADRLPQTVNIRIRGLKADHVMGAARDLAFSAGSACASGSGKPSHVLTAMGLTPDEARSAIRLSFGRFTTEEEIDFAAARLVEAVEALREAA